LANLLNSDLSRGFTVPQVAEKHGWTEPMVWSLALEDKEDLERFKELNWGLRTWDQWEWNDCDKRFGDDWPGRIPAQLIAHILFYFSKQNDLILDPMAGGGVTSDTCLALNRRCWAFEMTDRPEARPEIEPHTWIYSTDSPLAWPVSSKEKPDLIIFDPPYFDKKASDYDEKSISGLPKKEYLQFLEAFFALLNKTQKRQQGLPSSTPTGEIFRQTGIGRIPQRGNPDRCLPQHIKQNRLVAHPLYTGPHVSATLQRSSRLRNAEKKNTWSHIQVCDNSKTVVRHELVNIKKIYSMKIESCK